jgi:hypothetical protein
MQEGLPPHVSYISTCVLDNIGVAPTCRMLVQGLGYAASTPTTQLQEALQLKAGIVTSGGSQARQLCCGSLHGMSCCVPFDFCTGAESATQLA